MRPSYYDLIAALRTMRNHALRSSVDGRPCAPEAIAEATEVIKAAERETPPVDSDAAFDALLSRPLTRNERLQRLADAGCDTWAEYDGLR